MSDPSESEDRNTRFARLRRAHRDAKRERREAAGETEPMRLYGLHTVDAALANPRRRLHRLLVTRNALGRLATPEADIPCPVEITEPRALDRMLGADAVHQGALLEAEPLEPCRLAELPDDSLVVVLDQVTDPHNVGAILRTAAAFGAAALVTTQRHAARESGVLAKAASGALEHVPHATVVNLAEGLQALSTRGFLTIGLDSQAEEPVGRIERSRGIAIVLGAEGKGLRQKTRETVDRLVHLPMPGAIRSLNVSNAAAIMLYAVSSTASDRPD